MEPTKLIGSSTDSSMTIPLDVLGAPGAQGELIVKAMFRDRDNDNPIRMNDTRTRRFELKAKLSRNPPDSYDMNGAFDSSHGDSFFIAPDEVSYFEVEIGGVALRLDFNADRQVSMVSSVMSATTPRAVKNQFLDLLTRYLDRQAYVARVPIYVSMTVVRDIEHEVQYISFRGPPRMTSVSTGGEALAEEMKPVYALYREAMNSSSPYYRVLCFHKIMEGLLGSMRTSIRKRAKNATIELNEEKERIPDHSDFPAGLRNYVGGPVKQFYDNFLSKNYRDAMAHFTLKSGATLDVSSPEYVSQFIDVAFVSDLCTRDMIERHEQRLRRVLDAEAAQQQ